MNYSQIKSQLVNWLRHRLQERPAILGISGGVDSAVVAHLLVQAIPVQQIRGLILPASTNPPTDTAAAQVLAAQLRIQATTIPLDPLIAVYENNLPDLKQRLPGANLKARIRMTLLYGKANASGGLVIGTGNKSELSVGYFTKYGDGGVDVLPLGGLYKTQVWELANELGVAAAIIKKTPTAGLLSGQTDEADLQLSYRELDAILVAVEQGKSLREFSESHCQRVHWLMQNAQHKLSLPPIPKLS